MNKIRKFAFRALKKWFHLNWEKIISYPCFFCDDADDIADKQECISSCIVCAAPKILCGNGSECLYIATNNLFDLTDDFNPKKSIRLMRRGIIYLILFGKLPKRFVKRVKKYITKLNKELNKVVF